MLINNAGVMNQGFFEKKDAKALVDMNDVNMMQPIMMTKVFLDKLIQRAKT